METSQSDPTETKTGVGGKLWLIIAVVALIALAFFVWQYSSIKSEYAGLAEEKEMMKKELQTELDSLMIEHEIIKEQYGDLSDSLMLKDSLITAKAQEINDLLNFKWEYYKVKKKLDRLRVVAKTYVHEMDSLYTVNNVLVEENKEIKKKYNEEKEAKKGLLKEKAQLSDKLTEASVLKAYNTVARAILIKRTGTEKEVDKARRTSLIEVCFTIGENLVVEPGAKKIYVRIARPDNKILTPGVAEDFVFDYKGEQIQYSIFETVDYDNESKPICLRWVKKYEDVDMQQGIYEITIFVGEEEIGATSLELR
jgi:hypothetical protein